MSVIAFRRWRVGRNGELRALRSSSEYTWPLSGSALASCDCNSDDYHMTFHWQPPTETEPTRPHPVLNSRCGLYGYKRPVPACECDEPEHERHGAVGVVRLWGRSVEHVEGWRSLYAEPVAILDYTGRLDPAYAAPRYRDLATMYGEWAPDLAAHDHEPDNWCGHGVGSALAAILGGGTVTFSGVPLSTTIVVDPTLFAANMQKASHSAQSLLDAWARVAAVVPKDKPEELTARMDALEAKRNRDAGPKRNRFRRHGRD